MWVFVIPETRDHPETQPSHPTEIDFEFVFVICRTSAVTTNDFRSNLIRTRTDPEIEGV